jgi:ABC-2 type transport system ATP-binding protein
LTETVSTASVQAPSGTPALTIENLVVQRGKRTVLDGVNLSVPRGEVFGLLGPNGAGKTTLFHVLIGLLPQASGSIQFDGRAIGTVDANFRARTGVVFQEPALDPNLTARENLMLSAVLYAVPRSLARQRIDDVLKRADLADRADEPVSRFSGGMRRKVELGRALIHQPDLLFLDEPTSGLDEGAFRSFWADLTRLKREHGLTLLLTTHRPDEAEYCDRLAIIENGRVVACDTPDALRRKVRGDLLILQSDKPEEVAEAIRSQFGVETRVSGDKVTLRRDGAHELIPRIVEALPDGRLKSISLRRTGLGEVFLELTGHELSESANLDEEAT